MTVRETTTRRFEPEDIAEAITLLDGFDGVTAEDLVRPYVEWLKGLDDLMQMDDFSSVEFFLQFDESIRERAVRVSTILDRAGDLMSTITMSATREPYSVAAAAAARLVFEAVTASAFLRLAVTDRDALWWGAS